MTFLDFPKNVLIEFSENKGELSLYQYRLFCKISKKFTEGKSWDDQEKTKYMYYYGNAVAMETDFQHENSN
jgi:hypothetical protein